MSQDAWRAGYDAWKTTPPDDDCSCDGEECEHCGAPCLCRCECGDIAEAEYRADALADV